MPESIDPNEGSPGAASPDLAPPPPRAEAARAARASGLRSWAFDLLASILFSIFIIVFVYQPVRVEGTSMLPSLEDQDRLFISKFAYHKFAYHSGDIHRGDVVVFRYPHDPTKNYIKRVIAVPGDDLRIDHGAVWLNGVLLHEPYIPPRYQDDRSLPQTVLGPDEYFCMGDNRSISFDSRDFGPVDRSLIYGRAAFVIWPMDQVGVVR
jgi:signal peptidase I